jgi:hypothetical protein
MSIYQPFGISRQIFGDGVSKIFSIDISRDMNGTVLISNDDPILLSTDLRNGNGIIFPIVTASIKRNIITVKVWDPLPLANQNDGATIFWFSANLALNI